jgi:hypothetical protein
MKTLLFCLAACLLITGTATAQDIITKRNAEEIEGRVVEIGAESVKYKRASNPDGPTYEIARSEVFTIKYQNGEKEVFSTVDALTKTEEEKLRRQMGMHEAIRHKRNHVGIQLDGGVDGVHLKGGEGMTFVGYGGKIFFDSAPGDAKGAIGLAAGYKKMHYSHSEVDYKVTIDAITSDLYYTMETGNPEKNNTGTFRVGARMLMPVSAKVRMGNMDGDMLESLNPIQLGLHLNYGMYLGKSFLLGFDVNYMLTNLYKETSSWSYGIGMTLGYRF